MPACSCRKMSCARLQHPIRAEFVKQTKNDDDSSLHTVSQAAISVVLAAARFIVIFARQLILTANQRW